MACLSQTGNTSRLQSQRNVRIAVQSIQHNGKFIQHKGKFKQHKGKFGPVITKVIHTRPNDKGEKRNSKGTEPRFGCHEPSEHLGEEKFAPSSLLMSSLNPAFLTYSYIFIDKVMHYI